MHEELPVYDHQVLLCKHLSQRPRRQRFRGLLQQYCDFAQLWQEGHVFLHMRWTEAVIYLILTWLWE